MTDDELRAEADRWAAEVRNATGWGAAVSIADNFRRQCEQELNRRQHLNAQEKA
jgi:hypothetical protein